MTIFNLETKNWEIYKNQERFLAIQIDGETEEFVEIVHLFQKTHGMTFIEPLHNGDDLFNESILERFSEEDKTFLLLLDYYAKDNLEILIELLK